MKDSCDMFGRSCNELDCFLLFVICMALLIARKISFGVQPKHRYFIWFPALHHVPDSFVYFSNKICRETPRFVPVCL